MVHLMFFRRNSTSESHHHKYLEIWSRDRVNDFRSTVINHVSKTLPNRGRRTWFQYYIPSLKLDYVQDSAGTGTSLG